MTDFEIADLEIGDFPAATREEWLELVEQTLGDKPFETLCTTTLDEIEIQPLYEGGVGGVSEGGGKGVAAGVSTEGWDVLGYCELGGGDASRAGEIARAELAGGADGVVLLLDGPVSAEDMKVFLSVMLSETQGGGVATDGSGQKRFRLAFDAGPWWQSAAFALAQLAEAGDGDLLAGLGVDLDSVSLDISLRADPVAALVRHGTMGDGNSSEGNLGQGNAADLGVADVKLADLGLTDLVVKKPEALRDVRTVGVDGSVFADAGASEAQEVACSLAAGAWYLRELAEAGIDIDAACGELEFTYSATADQFATIAKFRAARLCWQRVAEELGASQVACRQRQHAVTSRSMLTRYEPIVNVLRSTVAAFAAGVAGVESQCVLPYDFAIGEPSEESRRLARNVSHILIEESRIGYVADPAGGSAYVRELTSAIAERAWGLFQEVEGKGGIIAALEDGTIGGWLEDSWQKRYERIVRRKDPICGVSEFPMLDEDAPGRASWITSSKESDANGLLPIRRLSEPFENLRDAAAASETAASGNVASGDGPKVFLVSLSSLATDSARLAFTENLLAAGGISSEVGSVEDYGSQNDQASPADFASVAVLCSSDAVYLEKVPDAVEALRAAGCQWVYLAGRPKGELAEVVEAAGVDGTLYAGCDAVALLSEMLERLGVEVR